MNTESLMMMGRTLSQRTRQDGWPHTLRAVARRVGEGVGARLGWDEPTLHLNERDVFTGGTVPAAPGRAADQLRIGIVCFPPNAGSGGHTTLFRMVRALEQRGHRCTLVFYEPTGGGISRHEPVIRRAWPDLEADIASVDDGLGSYDAVLASSWETAHVVATRNRNAAAFYFIQDYEPFFHAHGYLYQLAEITYSFGLQNIALGGMVSAALRRHAGVEAALEVPFGCDTDTYRLLETSAHPSERRRGVVYYAKRTVDRRGYLLAKATLERFHTLCPEQPIHVVGDAVHGWRVPVTQHGSLLPAELNRIYNTTIAGLAMSFTNVSLVPGELLAAGTVPVLNRLNGPRLDLDSSDAIWAAGHPDALAAALATTVEADDLTIAERARRLAGRPRPSWAVAQDAVADFIEETVRRGTEHAETTSFTPNPPPVLSVSGREHR